MLASLCAGVILPQTGFAAPMDQMRRTLHLTFEAEPQWAVGYEHYTREIKPLDDPHLRLNAGLLGGIEAARSQTPMAALRSGWSSLPHEEEAYPNADAMQAFGVSPFSIVDGDLVITASPLSKSVAPTLPSDMPRAFTSGAFNTYPYCQTYGYFEVTARIPKGKGLWPAFWLLPADGTWPPEIDATEILGNDTHVAYSSLHTKDHAWAVGQKGSYAGSTTTDRLRSGEDLSDRFHRYGVNWKPDFTTFYVDDVVVARRSTPADMHKPFYLIVNLAVGGQGTWPGPPDETTPFPARLVIRSVDAWALDDPALPQKRER